MAVVPALKSSMKSLRKGAPEFPPPPKTWLITTPEVVVGDGDGVAVGLGDGDAIGVGVGVGVPVGLGDGDAIGVGVAVGLGDGAGEGVGPGVEALCVFCGSLGVSS